MAVLGDTEDVLGLVKVPFEVLSGVRLAGVEANAGRHIVLPGERNVIVDLDLGAVLAAPIESGEAGQRVDRSIVEPPEVVAL